MRAIVNQSSDFPVRRTGSYRHKKALILRFIKLIVRSTYASDLRRAKISVKNIVRKFSNNITDDLTILLVDRTE